VSSAALLILASASPRRAQLLQQIHVPHRVVAADIQEQRGATETIEACVVRLARAKALHVQRQLLATEKAGAPLPVLGADTVVVVDEMLLGKPRDRAEALSMLERLSGRSHQVLSAVALASAIGMQHRLSRSVVRFRALSQREREVYWESGEPHDKAGAYAIQGRGAAFIESLCGSYSGVMGLPLFETAQLLAQAGVIDTGTVQR
jgi:septum formation protein